MESQSTLRAQLRPDAADCERSCACCGKGLCRGKVVASAKPHTDGVRFANLCYMHGKAQLIPQPINMR